MGSCNKLALMGQRFLGQTVAFSLRALVGIEKCGHMLYCSVRALAQYKLGQPTTALQIE